jgi:hypothetical protein
MAGEISMMFTMAFAMRTMRSGIGSSLYCQEIPIQVGLVSQIEALLADIEHFIFRTMNCGQVELDKQSLFIHIT